MFIGSVSSEPQGGAFPPDLFIEFLHRLAIVMTAKVPAICGVTTGGVDIFYSIFVV